MAARSPFGRTEEVEENAEHETSDSRDEGYRDGPPHADKDFKPVHLKGLFSVSTTSTKPPSVLKADIKKVLDRMQVQYRETKGGFECIHIPSIDISSVPESQSRHSHGNNHRRRGSSGSNETGKTGNISISMSMNMNTPRSLVKKASKMSFGMGKSRDRESIKEKEKEAELGMNANATTPDKELPHRPSVGTALSATPSGSSSFFNVSSTATTTATGHTAHTAVAEGSRQGEVNGTTTTVASPVDDAYGFPQQTARSQSPTKGKMLPPIPRDFSATTPVPPLLAQPQAIQPPVTPATPSTLHAPQTPRPTLTPFPTGEVDREVFEMIGANSMSVRFEINIIKVPWLPLHGIQFRRAGGDGWQYQMLARRVLTELKL